MADVHDIEATLLLALLHDIGHYQLSHMFEDLAADQASNPDSAAWANVSYSIPTDDDLFWSVLDPLAESTLRGGFGDAILNAWRASEDKCEVQDDRLVEDRTIARVIRDDLSDATYEALSGIHRAIYESADGAKPAHLVFGAVLSSGIDADKVSYLPEDSKRSGVNFGQGVDLDGLLGALRAPSLRDMTVPNPRPTIGITRQGVTAALSVATSRNQMLNQVYWHHTNRGATAMVKYAVARLVKAERFSMPDYIRETFFMEYERALEHLLIKFKAIRRSNEVNPLGGLIEGERRVYKSVFSTGRIKEEEEAKHLADHLIGRRYDDIIKLEETLTDAVREIVPNLKYGEVLVDVPLKERQRSAGDRGGRVFVYDDRTAEEGIELSKYTRMLSTVAEQHVLQNRVCRVFVSPRLAKHEKYKQIVDEVWRYMTHLR